MDRAARFWTWSDWTWLIFNTLVGALFLAFTAQFWIEPELRGESEALGPYVAFLFTLVWAGPVVLALNLVWLALRLRRKASALSSVVVLAGALGGWIALVLFSAWRL
jgi:hypothetical protein